MKTISRFDQRTCKETRLALDAALRAVSQEFGIRVTLGRGTYDMDGSEFRMKLTCKTLSDGNMTKTLPIIHTNLLPGTPIVMGTKFDVRGTEFTVCLIHHNRPKYKYIAVNARGTKYKFPADQVRRGM